MPKLSHVTILRNPNDSSQFLYSKEAERAAKILGVTIQFAEMQAPNDKGLEDALAAVVNQRANALLVTPYPFFADRRHQIILILRLGASCRQSFGSGFVNAGGLMSYGPNLEDMWRRPATYVNKILKARTPLISRSNSRQGSSW